VARIVIEASDKVLSHHAEREPRDVGTAQYSVPFSVALALFRDPADPQAFLDGPTQNSKILELCKRIELRAIAPTNDATCRLEITLYDGRSMAISQSDRDADDESEMLERQIEKKFVTLTSSLPDDRRIELLTRLCSIEQRDVAGIFSF
jgi:2-methylcitrate dehydratase PrpD